MRINVAFTHVPLLALGPGRRVGVWFQGCSLRCPGCMSEELWEHRETGWEDVARVSAALLAAYGRESCCGVTVSGGEPLEQADALRELLCYLASGGVEDILVYTGYTAAFVVRNFPWLVNTAGAMVSGPYRNARPTQCIWKGSANQRLTVFNPSLHERYQNWRMGEKRVAQVLPLVAGVRVLGILAPGHLAALGGRVIGNGDAQIGQEQRYGHG